MSQNLAELLGCLADGQVHSAQALARELAIGHRDVLKRIEQLRELGLSVRAESGAGYQLADPIQRLDDDRISKHLDQPPIDLELRFLVDSTNAFLSRELGDQPPPRALIARAQSQGRGRRGRDWISPPGAGLYLSLAWRFEAGLRGLSALSLVTGLAAAEVLKSHGLAEVALKWPNDLIVNGRKLGGCLIDINGTADGPCDAIAGLGINLDLGDTVAIDQPWIDLGQLGIKPDHNRLCAELINALTRAYSELDRAGFEAFEQRWDQFDALKNSPVRVERGHKPELNGKALGVDLQGRLQVETAAGIAYLSSGEVSVRAL